MSGSRGGICANLRRCFSMHAMPANTISTLLFVAISVFSADGQRTSIELQDASGKAIASAASKKGRITLKLDHEYQPGDRIVVHGPQWLTLDVSDTVPRCSVYLSTNAHGTSAFEIPYGSGEKHTGSSYPMEGFAGASHTVTVSSLSKNDRLSRRNLALNSCDMRSASPSVFPHASTNSVSRDAYNFEARNAIDGVSRNGHHGEWPYQSWGPLVRDDLWWKLEFGREVWIDTIRIMLRTDFPHDSYWKKGVVEFSDGTTLPLEMTPVSDFQDFHFPARHVSWLRLTHLVSAEERWSGLIEFEAWGRDQR